MDLWFILAALLSAAPAGVGQWMIVKDATVGVFNPNLESPVQFCTARVGSSLHKTEAGRDVFIYEYRGTRAMSSRECRDGYVVIKPERVSEIAVPKSK